MTQISTRKLIREMSVDELEAYYKELYHSGNATNELMSEIFNQYYQLTGGLSLVATTIKHMGKGD